MNLYKRCGCQGTCKHPWWYRFRFKGREFRGSTHTANQTLANQVAAKRRVDLLTGDQGIGRTRPPKLSVHIEAYTEWTQARNRTSGKDPDVLGRFLAAVGDKRLDKVTAFDVEKWKTQRAKGVKKSTVNRELNIVRGCFSRAVEWDLLSKSPLTRVKSFRVENTRLRVLSAAEVETFLTGASGDLVLMARVTLEALLRVSEVLNLRTSDIKGDHLVLPNTKGNKVLKVPVTAQLRRDLVTRAHRSGFVFGQDRYEGRPAKQAAVTHAFRRTMKRLGIKDASHHTLRHTGASVMLAEGASIRAVQEIGGWTSLRMLERYTHPTDAEKRRAVEISSRLTRVGTKTGTPKERAKTHDLSEVIKWLNTKDFKWRPQREPRPKGASSSIGSFGRRRRRYTAVDVPYRSFSCLSLGRTLFPPSNLAVTPEPGDGGSGPRLVTG